MVHKKLPERVTSLGDNRVSHAACGLNHTVCVSFESGKSWAFGEAQMGKLGFPMKDGMISSTPCVR